MENGAELLTASPPDITALNQTAAFLAHKEKETCRPIHSMSGVGSGSDGGGGGGSELSGTSPRLAQRFLSALNEDHAAAVWTPGGKAAAWL